MVNSQVTSITPASHADRHRHGGADPLTGDVRVEGIASTVTDVTASRTLGTTYQNTGVTDLYVTVWIVRTPNHGEFSAYLKSTSPADVCIARDFNGTDNSDGCLFIVVPPNYYYTFNNTSGSGVLNLWTEWT